MVVGFIFPTAGHPPLGVGWDSLPVCGRCFWLEWPHGSVFILALVYLNLFLVLLLKRRLSGRFTLADLVFPLIVLKVYQYPIFIGITNIAPAGLLLVWIIHFYYSGKTKRMPALARRKPA